MSNTLDEGHNSTKMKFLKCPVLSTLRRKCGESIKLLKFYDLCSRRKSVISRVLKLRKSKSDILGINYVKDEKDNEGTVPDLTEGPS